MSKELTAKNEQDALAAWSALNNTPARTSTNMIRLDNSPFADEEKNPEYGKLFAYYDDENGTPHKEEIPYGSEFKFIAAYVKPKCTDYTDGKAAFWANEVSNLQKDVITLTGPDKEVIAEGLWADLKARPDIKYSENVYVQYKERVFRWNLTGAHFDSWFGVKNSMKTPHTFIATGTQDEKKGTNSYKSLIFKLGEPYSAVEAMKMRSELDTLIKGPASPAIEAPKDKTEEMPWEEVGK